MFTGIIEHLGKVKQISQQANSAVIAVDIGPLKDGVIPGEASP